MKNQIITADLLLKAADKFSSMTRKAQNYHDVILDMPEQAGKDEWKFGSIAEAVSTIRNDFEVLSGNDVGDSGDGWQDVARKASVNLRGLADMLDSAARGEDGGIEGIDFPSFGFDDDPVASREGDLPSSDIDAPVDSGFKL